MIDVPSEFGLLVEALSPSGRADVDYGHWDRQRWARAVAAGRWHRLEPLLHRHLARRGDAPPDVVDELERAYLANAARNLFVDAELDTVLGALGAVDVQAVLLKGAALVETVYPDPALREMLDLDLLVRSHDLPAANRALAAVGYDVTDHGTPEDAQNPLKGLPEHHDPALVTDERIVAVELHHHIALREERAHFDIGGVWQRAQAAPSRRGHLVPAPEDVLLHICFHFTRNRLGGSWQRAGTGGALSQIGDIAWLVERSTLDWDAFTTAVRSCHLAARVFLALFAAHELGVPVPTEALAALRPEGFDAALGQRLIRLRVLRTNEHLPVRSLQWMVAPSREVLVRGWAADPRGPLSLARAYVRRARARAPQVRSALREPWTVVQDYRLNAQLQALEPRD